MKTITVTSTERRSAAVQWRKLKSGRSSILLALFTAMTAALTVADAAKADEWKVREGGSGGPWNAYATWRIKVNGEWRDARPEDLYPNYDDTVYIPNGLSVEVTGESPYYAHEEANNIYVCGAGENNSNCPECGEVAGLGTIFVCGNCSLTLWADSVVNGDLTFIACVTQGDVNCDDAAELRIHKELAPNVLKISGKGSVIRSGGVCGKIVADSETSSALLRIDGDEPGCLAKSMTIMAENLNMLIPIGLNNRGDVFAYHADVYLTDHRKDGNSGMWRAEYGTLYVNKEVRGGATWRTEPEGAGEIEFNDECLQLSGSFYLKSGKVRANVNVCTTGHGYHGGPGSSSPQITAKEGHKITFHGDCQ